MRDGLLLLAIKLLLPSWLTRNTTHNALTHTQDRTYTVVTLFPGNPTHFFEGQLGRPMYEANVGPDVAG